MRLQPWIFIVSATVLLAACASMQEETGAWSSFLAYRSALESGTEDLNFSDYLYNSEIEKAESQQLREEMINNVSFPLWVSKVLSHYEKGILEGRCLTVNGLTSDNEPMVMDMRFVSEDGVLKLAKVDIVHAEHEDNFATQARCPVEAPAPS